MVATNFYSFSSKSNKNQDIFLKFSAFVNHVSAHIWQNNFGQNSNSLPAGAHFGQNFGPSSNHICWDTVSSCNTLRCLINVRVLINVRGGKFWKNNKRTGPNKSTGWKKLMNIHTIINTLYLLQKKSYIFCLRYHWHKFNKRTVPNKRVLVGKNSEINKRMAYVY